MSVDVGRIRGDRSATLGHGVGIATFLAAVAFDNGQDVRHDPIEDNLAHALVIGRKPRAVRRAIRGAAIFISREEVESS